MDEKFKEYFRKRYPWTLQTPIENCPWHVLEYTVWEACKEAYGLGVPDEALEVPTDVFDNIKLGKDFKPDENSTAWYK